MPLSEHEQRLLDQIERALYAEDPKFATSVRSSDLRTHMRRRQRRAIVLFIVGVGLLLGGAVSATPAIGIVGFVVMLGALLLGVSAYKRAAGGSHATLRAVDGNAERGTRRGAAKRSPRPQRPQGSPRERLEDRWKKRWDERGGPQ